jgi:hypothetical protein
MAPLLLVALVASQPAAGDVIRPYIRRHLNALRDCYERALVREPRLEARVTLRLVFDGSGRVIENDATGAPTEELRACLLAAVRGWTLPPWWSRADWKDAAPSSMQLIVTYPLVFKPSRSVDELEQFQVEARACWDWALAIGADGETGAHVTRDVEPDGYEVVSVEETSLPAAAAVCVARAASRHHVWDTWIWFHAAGD